MAFISKEKLEKIKGFRNVDIYLFVAPIDCSVHASKETTAIFGNLSDRLIVGAAIC